MSGLSDLISRDSLDDLAEPAVVRAMFSLLSKIFELVPKMTFRSKPDSAI